MLASLKCEASPGSTLEHKDIAVHCLSWTSPSAPRISHQPCKKECVCFTDCILTDIDTLRKSDGMASFTRTQSSLSARQTACMRVITGVSILRSVFACTIASACASA